MEALVKSISSKDSSTAAITSTTNKKMRSPRISLLKYCSREITLFLVVVVVVVVVVEVVVVVVVVVVAAAVVVVELPSSTRLV